MDTLSRILFVDDDSNLLAAFQRSLRKHFVFDTAQGGEDALLLMRQSGPYAVIVADMRMPGMNGIELLQQAQRMAPDTVRVMLTGNADQQTAVDAVNQGHIFRFLNKPCEPEDMVEALEASVRHHQFIRLERELLEKTLAGSVRVLADVLGMIDPVSFGRGQKLRDSIKVFGRHLGLPSTWELEIAATLSQLGYVSVPSVILRKLDQGIPLAAREQAVIEKAPQVAHDLIAPIPRLEEVARMILYQSKPYDGGGFPRDAVAGERIPLGARILKILIDRALLEEEGVAKKKAAEAMKARHGHYDAGLLDQCFECFPDFLVTTISASREVRSVSLAALQVGQVLVSEIRSVGGALLVGAGSEVTAPMLNRLKNHAEFDGIKEPLFVQ